MLLYCHNTMKESNCVMNTEKNQETFNDQTIPNQNDVKSNVETLKVTLEQLSGKFKSLYLNVKDMSEKKDSD